MNSTPKLLAIGAAAGVVTLLAVIGLGQGASPILAVGAGAVSFVAAAGVAFGALRTMEAQITRVTEEKVRDVADAKRNVEKLQQGQEQLKKQVTAISSLMLSLQSIARQVGQSLEYKKILSFIVELITKGSMKAKRCSLWVVDPETHELRLEEDRGWSDVDREAADRDKEKQLFRQVLASKITMDAETMRRDPKFGTQRKGSIPSEICSPLVVGGEAVGLLNIEEFDNKAQSNMQDDVRLVSFLAAMAAMSIKNARLFEQTQEKATTDGLTKLMTHRTFQEHLDQELKRAERYEDNFSLVLTDIDHFKKFNDTYGHQIGDLVLREVANTMKMCGLDSNTIFARYGGEEFIVICPGKKQEEARAIAEKLRKAVEGRELDSEKGKLKVTISIGVSTFPDDAVAKSDLIKRADMALYKAKANGRNRVMLASETDQKVATMPAH